jgi:beta-fructofuranosidase
MLTLQDQWIWDFWTYHEAPTWHIWFLKADKSLADERLRHWNATQGHATSTDLQHWTHHGTCLAPSTAPAWDDKSVWTGSVVRDDQGQWHQFYTGTCAAEGGRRQRIGHAVSPDGHHWERVGDGKVLDLSARKAISALYEEDHDGPWDGRAMRDPWVMKDPNGPGWLMYFTARVSHGKELNARGAIGLARSDDLAHWRLQAPVYAGGDYGQLEVPQVFEIDGRWYCVYCNAAEHWSEARAQAYARAGHGTPVSGSHYLMADHPLGPWKVAEGRFLDGALPCRRYAAKVVHTGEGYALMGFNYWGEGGQFEGTVCDPVPVSVDPDTGLLSLTPISDATPAGRPALSAQRIPSQAGARGAWATD